MNKARIIISESGSGSIYYLLDRGNWKYSSFGVDQIRDLRKAVGDAEIEFVPCTFVDGTKLSLDIVNKYADLYRTKFVVDRDVDEVIDQIHDLGLRGNYKLYSKDKDSGDEKYLYVDSVYDAIIHIMFYYDIIDIREFMNKILSDAKSGMFNSLTDDYYLGFGITDYDGSVHEMRLVPW